MTSAAAAAAVAAAVAVTAAAAAAHLNDSNCQNTNDVHNETVPRD